jgi:hypothetical protein
MICNHHMTQIRTIRRADRWTSSTSPVDLSVVIPTVRKDPGIDRIVSDMSSQIRVGDRIEIIVVDALRRSAEDLADPADDRILVRSVSPKPTPWQGPQRVTSDDWWAASSARNTGIALCRAGHVAFLDDRSELGPEWLDRVRSAAHEKSIVAGSYDRRDGGSVAADHRRDKFPDGLRRCSGGWLYSGSFCSPLSWLLEVNGFEEGCDGSALEDCVLGHMLANRGAPIHFDARMHSVKSDARSGDRRHGFLVCRDPGRIQAIKRRFYSRRRTEFTPDLRAMRAAIASGMGFPDVDRSAPHLDWYDKTPLQAMLGRPY